MSEEMSETVGVIGMGIIGGRVAEVLRRAGKHVYVWNRTPKPVPNFVASPGEMALLTKVIQIFVSDGQALLDVVGKLSEHLGGDHVVINHSTVDPQTVVEAYRKVRATGAVFLDAPFTGSRGAAEQASLVYYVGGDPDVLARVRPLLEISASQILFVGKVGEASLIKIATNMISATTVEVLAEAYGLVMAAGMDPGKLAEALESNACRSPLLSMKLPAIMEGDYDTHFSLRHMFKDAQFAIQLARELKVEIPALTATASLMYRGIQQGQGEKDYSVLAARYQKEEK